MADKTPAEIYELAVNAATEAMQNATPTPMGVYQANPLTGEQIGPTQVVDEGACGFAYVIIRPARGKLVTWLKKNDIGYKGYQGGWWISMSAYTGSQSVERKEAGARAFAQVLKDNGLTAYTESRLD